MAQKERVAPVAVITGASSGLGAVFARIAAREGYRPVLVARRQQRLEALAAEIETASGLKPWVLALDLTESAELSRLMDFLETRSVTPKFSSTMRGLVILVPWWMPTKSASAECCGSILLRSRGYPLKPPVR